MKKELTYVIFNPRSVINLNLFEAEKYESAVVVQQLIGNLIYFSNKGRYEPRIAERWERVAPHIWTFFLKENFKTENGELINSRSFKKSIERAIYIYSKLGEVPVLGHLKGYKRFLSDNSQVLKLDEISEISGIKVFNNEITFEFDLPIKSGLLQILSFSPFGYISIENYNQNGSWKNDSQFVSSGPYKVKKIDIGKEYELEKNPFWLEYADQAPDTVYIKHEVPDKSFSRPLIVDAFTHNYENSYLHKYSLVPEYINSVLLGNLRDGYFSSVENRNAFKAFFGQERDSLLPDSFGSNVRSSSFYPGQDVNSVRRNTVSVISKNSVPLIIEGRMPDVGTPRFAAWQILKNTLEKNNLSYKFSDTEAKFEEMVNPKYDIRIRGSSIGGGVEAWGIFVIFCSPFGINFPDPSGRVCKLIEEYDKDIIDENQLTQDFLKTVDEDSAILPVSHYGIQMYFSNEIYLDSVSPIMSIMRFDQVEIKYAN